MSVLRRASGLLHGLLFGGALYGFLVVVSILVLPVIWSRRLTAALVRGAVRLLVPLSLWVGGVRLRATGAARMAQLEREGGYIMVANHASNLDPVVLARATGRVDLAFVAKAETLRRPLTGRLVHAIGWIPVERDNLVALKRFQEEVETRKRTGWIPNLVVFPEGTRSVDGRLQPFRLGPFLLAAKTGLPILPVVLRGTHPIHRKNAFAVYPGTVRLDVGEPIRPPAKVRAVELVDVAQDLMKRTEAIFRAVTDLNSVDDDPVVAAEPSPTAVTS